MEYGGDSLSVPTASYAYSTLDEYLNVRKICN